MVRRLAPGEVLEVFVAQSEELLEWAAALSASELAGPSSLPEWTVAELLSHLAVSAGMVAEAVTCPAPRGQHPLAFHEYVASYAPAAGDIAARARSEAPVVTDAVASLSRRTGEAVEAASAVAGDPVLVGRRGPLRFSDLLVTRVVELVVHGRDLGRSLPARPAPVTAAASRLVTRTFAEVLAARHPGRAVELRVPPYAAVQMLEGATHTRGTPPNVVETDPGTFVDLASGRLRFAEAVDRGAVRASGMRSDLSGVLPVLG